MEESYKKAGIIARDALAYGLTLIKPGASMREVLDKVEAYIEEHGGEMAFPAQSCVNEIAAHYCPTESDDHIYQQGDLVKLDVGVHIDGYIADNATTISLSGEHDEIIAAAKDALAAIEKILKAGVTPTQIGAAAKEAMARRGMQPIHNLTGHGLARFTVHTSPSIPNYPSGEHTPLKEGQVIAIEPFATSGTVGMIGSAPPATIFSLRGVRPVRSPQARAVLEFIARYNGLPFTTRWVTRALGAQGTLGLAQLRREGLLEEYPPLPEKSGGLVAQHENTYIITKDGFVKTTG